MRDANVELLDKCNAMFTKGGLNRSLREIGRDLDNLLSNPQNLEYFELAFLKSKFQTELLSVDRELDRRGKSKAEHAKTNAIWNRIDKVDRKIESMMAAQGL